MAEAFPDLSYARTIMDRLMVDTCKITRDVEGPEDGVWDPTTLTYTKPVGDDVLIYQGKCKFAPQQNRADLPRQPAGRPEITRTYDASIPYDAPEIRPGDLFTVVTSARDLRAVNKTFVVLNQVVATMLVVRRLTLEDVADAFIGIRGS